MATRIYKTPFAATGDKEDLATADQPDGKVSLQAGWTPDYELPNDDPNYRPVGRAEMNGVLNEITESLGEMQQNGFALWRELDGGWSLGAIVVHNGEIWRSLIESNTDEPGSGEDSWASGLAATASTDVPGIVELATNAETQAGTDAQRAVTPAGLQSTVQSSPVDATAGRLLPVGAFGLGSSQAPNWPNTDMDADPSSIPAGFYRITATNTNRPAGVSSWVGQWMPYNSSTYVLKLWPAGASVTGVAPVTRYWGGGAWSDWLSDVRVNDFTGSSQSLADAGYQKLPGGMIIQWGSAVDTDTPKNFPIAFPNACLAMVASIFPNANIQSAVTVEILSTSTFRLQAAAYGGQNSYYFAIGF